MIFVNLKRFEVPKSLGGICPMDNPHEWMTSVIKETHDLSSRSSKSVNLTFFLPEGLISVAFVALQDKERKDGNKISIGCQGVHWEDVVRGGNFGAFTSVLPAASAKALGCTWAMIGHSEERKSKLDLLKTFEPQIDEKERLRLKALDAVDEIINQETLCALKVGLNVLLCIGETSEQKGQGNFEDQKPRIREVLKAQLAIGLNGAGMHIDGKRIVIGYEPVWAIGPGKYPPGREYIGFVSSFIKETVQELFGFTPSVVYGGGLKEENASMIASIDTIDGGLVALTRFTPPIGFEPQGLARITEKYLEGIS